MDTVQNLKFKIVGDVVTITMDASQTFGLSKSGKTTSIFQSLHSATKPVLDWIVSNGYWKKEKRIACLDHPASAKRHY